MNKTFTILTVLLALPLSAQTTPGSFEVSPFVGYNLFDKNQNLKDHLNYGGRLGYNFTQNFALEGAVEFINSNVDDRSITTYRPGQFRAPYDKVDSYFYHLDGIFSFRPEKRFNPFVAVGFGGGHYSPKISDKDMSMINIGVGAKVWLAERFALRFDLRDNFVTEVSPWQKGYSNLSATVGLVFSFGGKTKTEPVQVATTAPAPAPVDKVILQVAEEPVPLLVEKVKALPVKPKVVILAFEDVHFDLDKATLRDDAKLALKQSILTLKLHPETKIRVAGYTSASGTTTHNQSLSERRATAVRDYLIEEGLIPRERLSIIGYGETRPLEQEASPKDLYSKAAKANMTVLFEVEVK